MPLTSGALALKCVCVPTPRLPHSHVCLHIHICNFKNVLYFVCASSGVHTMMWFWRFKDNLQELVFSTVCVLGIELLPSDLHGKHFYLRNDLASYFKSLLDLFSRQKLLILLFCFGADEKPSFFLEALWHPQGKGELRSFSVPFRPL